MEPSAAWRGRWTVVHTPRMPVWGGLITGVKDSTPKEPRLVTVKVPPLSRSGLMLPLRALAARSFTSREISSRLLVSALKMVGTMRPLGVSTATPRFTCLKRRMLFSSSMLAFRSGQESTVRETA